MVERIVYLRLLSKIPVETWPSQPIRWPDIKRPCWCRECRCMDGSSFSLAPRPRMEPHQAFHSSFDGNLFFKTRAELDLFLGPLHALGPNVRFLGPKRTLIALEPILSGSAGGPAFDRKFGDGFVLMVSTDGHMPQWNEANQLDAPDRQRIRTGTRSQFLWPRDDN